MKKLQDISTALFTHQGRKSPNEDFAGSHDFAKNSAGIRKLVVLADGMGGYNAGEVASKIAVETVISEISKAVSKIRSDDDLRKVIVRSVEKASAAIFSKASSEPSARGMGTTVAITLLTAEKIYIANVGDSRIYLISRDKIRQLSEDHTPLAEAMKSKEMTAEEIKNFPYKHAVTRYSGDKDPPEVFIDVIGIVPDSALILCSDGLTDVVSDDGIMAQVTGTTDIQYAVDNLGKLAFHRGSNDNITVFGIESGSLKRSGTLLPREKRIPMIRMKKKKATILSPAVITILAGLLLTILLASLGIYSYLKLEPKSSDFEPLGQISVQGNKKSSDTQNNKGVSLEDVKHKPDPPKPKKEIKKQKLPAKSVLEQKPAESSKSPTVKVESVPEQPIDSQPEKTAEPGINEKPEQGARPAPQPPEEQIKTHKDGEVGKSLGPPVSTDIDIADGVEKQRLEENIQTPEPLPIKPADTEETQGKEGEAQLPVNAPEEKEESAPVKVEKEKKSSGWKLFDFLKRKKDKPEPAQSDNNEDSNSSIPQE